MRQGPSRIGAAFAVLGLVLQSCTIPVNTARMEALMIKAGFQIKRADTPERLAHLKTLAPLTLVKHERAGAPYYVFADPAGCQCVYVGNEAAYRQYRKLVQESQLAAEQRLAESDKGGGMQWGVWDPFFW